MLFRSDIHALKNLRHPRLNPEVLAVLDKMLVTKPEERLSVQEAKAELSGITNCWIK